MSYSTCYSICCIWAFYHLAGPSGIFFQKPNLPLEYSALIHEMLLLCNPEDLLQLRLICSKA